MNYDTDELLKKYRISDIVEYKGKVWIIKYIGLSTMSRFYMELIRFNLSGAFKDKLLYFTDGCYAKFFKNSLRVENTNPKELKKYNVQFN